MACTHLLIEDAGAVRRITLNRADKLNALNRALLDELGSAMQQARHAAAVRVVVLAGVGDKAFVAGADIAEMADLSPAQAQAFSQQGQSLMRSIETLGKPVLARIQGYALGGGLELAMACHLRIASTRAKLGQPEVGLGLIPGFGGTQRLTRLCGRGAALELCLLGAPIDAQRAQQLGLLTRVVAPEALDAEVDAVAAQFAAAAPQAMRHILACVIEGSECALDQALAFETQAFALCFAGSDMREGTRAFIERRKPLFDGH